MTDELTDILAATAAALGWCVGKLQGQTNGGSAVPAWVKNALSDATRPHAQADFRERLAAERKAK